MVDRAGVLAVAADSFTADGVETVIRRTVETFGGLDILVNNVGIAKGAGIADTSDADWQAAFDQTLFPAVRGFSRYCRSRPVRSITSPAGRRGDRSDRPARGST